MVLLEFSMYPLGRGESLSRYVARSLEIIDASGLDYRCHAMGTVIEGEYDEVMDVVQKVARSLLMPLLLRNLPLERKLHLNLKRLNGLRRNIVPRFHPKTTLMHSQNEQNVWKMQDLDIL